MQASRARNGDEDGGTPSSGKKAPGKIFPLRALLPGLLVAATGVGAGDLATAAFTGDKLGVAILWAVLLGALLKFALNEGLARVQLATGETFLESGVRRFGRTFAWTFLAYLIAWSFFVGGALMSACGVAFHAALPVFSDARTGKVVFGLASSALGLWLTMRGGFQRFERLMGVLVALMFATVITTALMLVEDLPAVLRGLFVPEIPHFREGGLSWTIALMGGVGGTLTVLCYGYWIREEGRSELSDLRTCRLDLATGYLATALFGMAMVVIGATIHVEGSGATLIAKCADRLAERLGTPGRALFLLGSCAAVFSSLLGVWQAVPYLFADLLLLRGKHALGRTSATPLVVDLAQSRNARRYRWALATLPALGLFVSFREIQKIYAIFGACFMPLLALTLLEFGFHLRRRQHAGSFGPWTWLALGTTVLVFAGYGFLEIRELLS